MPKINAMEPYRVDETIFTDRIEARDIFWRKYDVMTRQRENYEIINYFGIPGIGKSRLCEKLQQEMLSKGLKEDYLFLDFENHVKESYEYLAWMAEKLNKEQKCLFPLFSYALSYFYAKRMSEDNKEIVLDKFLRTKYPNIYKMVTPLITAAGFSPKIGNWSSFFTYSDVVMEKIRNMKNDIEALDVYNSEKIEKRLSYFFAQDLRQHFENRDTPFVFFLDTYDMFYNELNSVGDISCKDNWLKDFRYGIVDKIPNVIWVVFGREELNWGSYNKELQVTEVPLTDFEDEDTEILLKSAGIQDTRIIERIKKVTNGLPLHISLCIEHYYEMIMRGQQPTIDSFGYSYKELLREFIKYMNEEEQDVVYIMACLKKWNSKTFCSENAIATFGISQIAYNRIMKLSFVLTDDEEYFYLHQEARAVLQVNCPKNIRAIYSRYMDNGYARGEITEEERQQYICGRIESALNDIELTGSESLKAVGDIFELNAGYIYEYLNDYEYAYFEGIYAPFIKIMDSVKNLTQYDDAIIYAKVMAINTMYLARKNRYREAYENQLKIVSILESVETEQSEAGLTEKYRLLSIQLLMPKEINKWKGSVNVLLKDCEQVLGKEHELTKGVLYIAQYMKMVNRLEYEIDTVKKFVKEEIRMYGEMSPRGIKANMNLALAYKMHGNYHKAIKIGEETCRNMNMFLEEYDLDYIHAKDNLAIAYIHRGKSIVEQHQSTKYEREKAKRDFERALELSLENHHILSMYYKDEVEDSFPYLYQIISSYVCLGDFYSSERYCISALNCVEHKKHEDDGGMNLVYDTLATIYKMRGEYKKALPYVKLYYYSICNLEGKNSPLALALKQTYQQYEKWS